MKAKYETCFWMFIIIAMVMVAAFITATSSYAAEKTVNLSCKARNVQLIKTTSDYLFAVVDFERGNFRELPDDNENRAIFYNLDTGKVLIIGEHAQQGLYISVYKNVEDSQAKKPEYQDNCHF